MGRIRVLEDTLINQIAAGEVVERPASVVKELVENSLDASATRIDVAISEGGLRWICVTDNGIGMSEEDARLAFQRHATSKLNELEDLQRISTLGFRGEALPSIASVADVRMRTRRAEDSIGTEIKLNSRDAVRVQVSQVACNPGTRIEVAQLFGSIPARRKFMKTPVTESTHITRLLERYALARPEIRLSLEKEGKSSASFLPTSRLRERLDVVLATTVGERLLEFDGRSPLGRAHGFAAPTDLTRSHTNDIYLFVNGRSVRDRLLSFAVRHAYRDALPPGRHPVVVLFLELAPQHVDVNVHPAKTEVRFREPDAIRQLVSQAIAAALGRQGARDETAISDRDTLDPRPYATRAASDSSLLGELREGSRVRQLRTPLDLMLVEEAPVAPARTGPLTALPPPEPATTTAPANPLEPPRTGTSRHSRPTLPFAEHRVLGQLLGTYLVLERPGELVLLDQHAAHERVLFERLRDRILEDKLERQLLLLPTWIELPRSTTESLLSHRGVLERVGYELEFAGQAVRGGMRVGIKAVPALLRPKRGRAERFDWVALLEETASGLADRSSEEARGGVEAALHHVLATAACHAATRKGDRLSNEEIASLLKQLDETVWFPNCPHGRPISHTLSESELERRFLRA